VKRLYLFGLALFVFPLSVMAADDSANRYENIFHTTPDKWNEPRIFHQPLGVLKGGFDKNFLISDLIYSEFNLSEKEMDGVIYSANNAYWYYIPEHNNKSKCRKHNCPIEMYIYNERDKVKKFTFTNVFKSSSVLVEWINEKIIYIEPWLDKNGGYYIIYDVEKERIIQAESVRAGGRMYHLWSKDCDKKENKESCPK